VEPAHAEVRDSGREMTDCAIEANDYCLGYIQGLGEPWPVLRVD
jgi:hypothetical protein